MMTDDRENGQENQEQGQDQYSFWNEKAGKDPADQTQEQEQYTNWQWDGGVNQEQNTQNQSYQYEQQQDFGYYYQQYPYQRERRPSAVGKVIRIIAAAACAGVVAGGCFTGVIRAYRRFSGHPNDYQISIGGQAPILDTTPVLDNEVRPETEVTNVYKSTIPAVVSIDALISNPVHIFGQTYDQEAKGSGSGIIVGKTETELLIATNNHVVDGATKIEITFNDGMKAEGITKGTDASADLGVVSVDLTQLKKSTLEQIKVATLGNSDEVLEGEMAIAIGNALGYGQSITVGYISAVNRTVHIDDRTMKVLQTDAAINPGNSGGALLNKNGEVIGINSAKLAADSIEGIGYAIPISYAYPILEELMSREIIKEEDQGYLGVQIQDVTEETAAAYNIPMGIFVRGFVEDSAAKKAGLLERDIITAINDVEVTTRTSLKEKVSSYRYGMKVKVAVERSVDGEYKHLEFEVTLGRNPLYKK